MDLFDPSADHYGVLGNPVAHSLSPDVHAEFARRTGQQICYHRFLVEPGRFEDTVADLRRRGIRGLNVTLPCKADAWRAATVRTPRAEASGSVNTMWFGAGSEVFGDTTDGTGLIRDLRENGVELAGRSILVLGAGGSVAGILDDLLASKPRRLQIANRTVDKARHLLSVHRATTVEISASGYEAIGGGRYDLVINATSAGLHGELPPLPSASILAEGACCYDLVYGDPARSFLEWARAQGAARTLDGLGMLVEQAAESFFIWRGVRPETRPVIEWLRPT